MLFAYAPEKNKKSIIGGKRTKKIFALLLAVVMTLGLLAGCGTAAETPDTEAPATEAPAAEEPAAEPTAKKIDTLKVAFVPSREPQEIITVTEPLQEMLKNELAALGYEVGEVEITVGTTYEAVGEGLEAGTIDVGLIPGGTYVLYDDGAEVILTATRDGLSKDSDNAKDWNDGQPTEASDRQAVSYRALFIAGPSEKGKELQDKVNAGEELTWTAPTGASWARPLPRATFTPLSGCRTTTARASRISPAPCSLIPTPARSRVSPPARSTFS